MTSLYHIPFDFNAVVTSALMNEKLGQLDSSLFDFASGVRSFNQINLGTGEGAGVALTIASGVITISRSHHTVDVQTGTTDDLDTINGGVNGDELTLRLPTGSTNTVVVKHNTGNIFLAGESDVTLTSPNKALKLFYNGAFWTDSGGAGGGALFRIKPRTALSVATSSITLSSIPAYYTHLKLVLEMRTTLTGGFIDQPLLRFNGDSGANYDYINFIIDAGNVDTEAKALAQTNFPVGFAATTADTPAGYYGLAEVFIPNYASASQPRTLYYDGFLYADQSVSTWSMLRGGGAWRNSAAAINSITILLLANNFAIGSAYTLYGLL